MIIKNFSFIDKKEKILAYILSFLTILGTLLIFYFIKKYVANLKADDGMIGIIALILFLSIPSFDILTLANGNISRSLKIIWWVKSRWGESKTLIIPHKYNDYQRLVCEGVNGYNKGLESLIHIYGRPNKGKTTTAFFVLYDIFMSNYKGILQVKQIILVDCSTGKDAILNFFQANCDRLKEFRNTIIIIDNIELLGYQFINANINFFQANEILFIIIEDISERTTQITTQILPKVKQHDFNKSILLRDDEEEKRELSNLITTEIISKNDKQKIFFYIFFSILVQKYVHIKQIVDISKINKRRIKSVIKRMRPSGLFSLLPFNKEYIYAPKSHLFEVILQLYEKNKIYNEVLSNCISNKSFAKENPWILFILKDYVALSSVNIKKRHDIFNKSLSKGLFQTLYGAICMTIRATPRKKELFLYEYAVLSYYMSCHSQAFILYDEYLKSLCTDDEKMKTIVRIIEVSHGLTTLEHMSKLKTYIEVLKGNKQYAVYGRYWEAHIKIEKGIFNINDLSAICKDLKNRKNYNDYLYIETCKRCYTDILRCHYILGQEIPNHLKSEFENFLLSINQNIYDFYYNLYIKAFNLQYTIIPSLRYGEESEENIEQIVNDAKIFYEKTISSNYSNQKARLTISVRLAELEMIDINNLHLIRRVEHFLLHASSNRVDLHTAYAETLMAKFKIVMYNFEIHSLDYLDSIYYHLNNSREIYTKYDNIYGIFRVEFLVYLSQLYIGNTPSSVIDNIKILVESHHSYCREKKLYQIIKEKYDNYQLHKTSILWIVKTYPIILQ